jgi:uncharacterized membrane protein
MIDQETQQEDTQLRFVIMPNRSLSWRGNLIFFLIMVAISFGIASAFAVLGYWVVLPFAGLEMVVLGAALYLCAMRSSRCEVISLGNDAVEVVIGRHKPEHSHTFNRHWMRVVLTPPRARGHPSRLLLCSHGRELEIGACLNNEERQQLAKALEKSLGK